MNEAEQAIPVGSIEVAKIQQQIQEARSSVEKELDDREAAYADMALTRGWELFKEEIQGKIEAYRGLKNIDPSQMSLANIGLRFMVGQTVADELQGLLNRVNIAVEESNGKQTKVIRRRKKK